MMNRKEYEDSIYRENIKDIINDIYYSNASYTTKISRSRTLAEYIIRRLIKQSPNSELALGDDRTRNELKKRGSRKNFFGMLIMQSEKQVIKLLILKIIIN